MAPIGTTVNVTSQDIPNMKFLLKLIEDHISPGKGKALNFSHPHLGC